jgi:uncharacterized protein involved in outer membrane biogenesis
MKKAGIAAGIALAVIVLGVIVFALTFDINRYRDTIRAQLEKRLNRTVNLGEMHASLFPPRFRVQNAAISDDPRFNPQRPFVQTDELDVSAKLLPLLHKSVEIDSLELRRPRVELIKNRDGVWNFSSLAAGGKQGGDQQLSLSELLIRDGQVAVTDLHAGTSRSVYDHIDLTVRDFARDRQFSIDAAAHLPGRGEQQLKLQGKAGPIAQGRPAATPFHGTLTLAQVGLGGLREFLNAPALAKTDGVLSGQINLSSENGKMTANGQTTVQNARMNGRDLGYPIAARYNISDDLNTDILTIQNATVTLGTTPLTVSGTMDSKSTPARIDLSVTGKNVSIAEAAKLAAASGKAFTPGAEVTGVVDANIHARGAVSNPALTGNLSARNVQISGKDLPLPVQVGTANVVLTPEEIRSDPFNVTSGGTTAAVRFNLRQYLSNTPVIDASLNAPNAALPAVLSMAKAYGITALDKVSGAGVLKVDLRAAGPLKLLSSSEIARTLNGTVDLNLNNVRYAGGDISHDLSTVAGFLGGSQADRGFTTISRLTGTILIRSGIAETNNLQALLDLGNLGIRGTANLVSEALNLRATAVMSKDTSQKVGGTGIAGYMRTALANNQGELVVPVLITGTFQHPTVAPDLQQVGQLKLKGLVPNFDNPASAVSGILGNVLGQKSGTAGARPQQQPNTENPVQDLVNLLGGRKKEQQKK